MVQHRTHAINARARQGPSEGNTYDYTGLLAQAEMSVCSYAGSHSYSFHISNNVENIKCHSVLCGKFQRKCLLKPHF